MLDKDAALALQTYIDDGLADAEGVTADGMMCEKQARIAFDRATYNMMMDSMRG